MVTPNPPESDEKTQAYAALVGTAERKKERLPALIQHYLALLLNESNSVLTTLFADQAIARAYCELLIDPPADLSLPKPRAEILTGILEKYPNFNIRYPKIKALLEQITVTTTQDVSVKTPTPVISPIVVEQAPAPLPAIAQAKSQTQTRMNDFTRELLKDKLQTYINSRCTKEGNILKPTKRTYFFRDTPLTLKKATLAQRLLNILSDNENITTVEQVETYIADSKKANSALEKSAGKKYSVTHSGLERVLNEITSFAKINLAAQLTTKSNKR